jgi:uncharacterized membrane protein YedE/YeeE
MTLHDFTPLPALAGGALIGLSATLLLLTHGKVAGVSGLVGRILQRHSEDRPLGLSFVAGLALAGLLVRLLWPAAIGEASASLPAVIVAGLLVGYGTRLGNGCTSGHGVCGLSRLSVRSLVATLTFIGTGAVSVFVVRHLLGGAS